MVIFRSIFSIFLLSNTQLTHLNASNLLNFDSLNHFLPIASQSWCSGVSKMATSTIYFKLAEIVRDNQAKISKYGQKIGKK